MKPHHLLGILCIALLACFGALLVVHFNQASDMLVLEKELASVTAERDQLVLEIEELNANLENHKLDIHNLKVVYEEMVAEHTNLRGFLKSAVSEYERKGSSAVSSIMSRIRLEAVYASTIHHGLPALLSEK